MVLLSLKILFAHLYYGECYANEQVKLTWIY
jgi:hypothetical protein